MNSLKKNLRAGLLGSALIITPLFAQQSAELSDLKLSDFQAPANFNFASGNIDEAAIGRQLFRKLRQHRPIIEDPELSEWIKKLANRLARTVPGIASTLHIAIENNPQINAYTLQGGIIIINSGLILSSDSESELAAVIAHEIAHVSQRHLNRMLADSKNRPLLTGIGILAGAAVASKSPEAGQAIIAGASALQAHQQISYSHTYESEADREGLRILANAGLDPNGMPVFLEKLDRSEPNVYGDISKYMRSHPLSIDRLSDTRNRAKQLRKAQARESIDYLYAREKLRAWYDRNGTVSRRPVPDPINRYQQAVKAAKQGNHQQVIQLIGKRPAHLASALLIARSLNQLRRYREAEQILRPLSGRYPNHEALILQLARSLSGKGQTAQGLQLLRRIKISDKTSLEFLEIAQTIAQQSGQRQEAILYHAERNLRVGEYKYAKLSLEQVINTPAISGDIQARAQNLLNEVKLAGQEIRYLKKR